MQTPWKIRLDPVKTVNKENVKEDEEFTYKVKQQVYQAIQSNYYKSFEITDTLDNCLEVDTSKITIKNDNNQDVTSNFNITNEGQKIIITPKNLNAASFYGITYRVEIKTKVKENYDLRSYKKDGRYEIPNHATTTYKDSQDEEIIQDTEEVKVNVLPKHTILVHHYKENTTEKLGEDVNETKYYGDPYQTSPLTNIPEGYELVGTPSNAEGTIEDSDIVVNYYYKLKDVTLTVKHLEEGTNTPLTNDIIENKKYGESYTTAKSNDIPDNYELVTTPENVSGTIKENLTVTYYYKKKAEPIKPIGQITVRYVDEEGKEIEEAITSQKEVGNTYTSSAKEIEGYILKQKPTTESYTYQEGEQIVTYIYSRIKLKVETKVKGIGGTIEGAEEVLYGNDSTKDKIKITADKGYLIDKVTINGKEIGIPSNSETLSISNFIKMKENKIVEVSFKEKPKEAQVVNVPKTDKSSIIAVTIGLILLIIASTIYYIKFKKTN